MPTQKEIYQSDGDRYEALISREDHQGNILKAIREIMDLDGKVVFDTGAGTGRLACMLAPFVSKIRAFDVSEEMLRVCRDKFQAVGSSNWQVEVADHRKLPVEDRSADAVVSGWSVSYLAVWNPESWMAELATWLIEMKRVIKPGGHVILFESLGTGHESPFNLSQLSNFYPWLDETGFQNKWIRTDYQFTSLEEAEYLSRFFFGDEMGDRVKENNWVILPECTGVWWLRIDH
jgi:ubiquinone/menaquinone biosynthesis C-methylase UbiE